MLRIFVKLSLFLSGFFSLTVVALPVLSVTPSIKNIVVRSDGGSSIVYTVANNLTRVTISDLTITPGYNSKATGLTTSNNNCTGTLAPGATCTFKEIIPGASQPGTFVLRPRVCIFNNAVCAQPEPTNIVNVTDTAITTPVRAYVGLATGADQDKLKAITVSDDSVASSTNADYDFGEIPGGIVVSPDGQDVYVANTGSTLPSTVAVTDVSATTPATPTTIDLENNGDPVGAAVTPNGSFLYVVLASTKKLYKIDLSNNKVDTIINLETAGLGTPSEVVTSPDSQHVYVSGNSDDIAEVNVSTNAVTIWSNIGNFAGAQCGGLAVSPDGTRLYVGVDNGTPVEPGLAVVDTTNNGDVLKRVTDDELNSADNPIGLAISSDGNTLYLAENAGGQVVSANLTDLDNITVTVVNADDVSTPIGVALTPDGNTLFVTNSASDNVTKIELNNGNAATNIPVGGQTYAISNFVG